VLHGGGAVWDVVDSRDEVEILANTEILIILNFLRHVADVTLDLGLVRAHVVAEAGAAAGSGVSRPQSMRMNVVCRCRSGEEAVDLAAPHREVDGVDDGLVAKALVMPVTSMTRSDVLMRS